MNPLTAICVWTVRRVACKPIHAGNANCCELKHVLLSWHDHSVRMVQDLECLFLRVLKLRVFGIVDRDRFNTYGNVYVTNVGFDRQPKNAFLCLCV